MPLRPGDVGCAAATDQECRWRCCGSAFRWLPVGLQNDAVMDAMILDVSALYAALDGPAARRFTRPWCACHRTRSFADTTGSTCWRAARDAPEEVLETLAAAGGRMPENRDAEHIPDQ
jgi:hypothetical protein